MGEIAEHQHGVGEFLLHRCLLLAAAQQVLQRQAVLVRLHRADAHPEHEENLAQLGPLLAIAVVHQDGFYCHNGSSPF